MEDEKIDDSGYLPFDEMRKHPREVWLRKLPHDDTPQRWMMRDNGRLCTYEPDLGWTGNVIMGHYDGETWEKEKDTP